jgi:hypothetical protein
MRGVSGRFWGLCAGAGLLSILTGCASVTQGTEQSIKIETLAQGGAPVEGAECQLSNDKGMAAVSSGQTALVRRSGGNLMVQCTLVGHAPAVGQAVSRGNAGLAGNIVAGGLIGVAIDVGTGAAYTYPTWMQLVFGEERLFDRSGNRNDGPVAGTFVRATVPNKAAGAASPAQDAPAAVVGSSSGGEPGFRAPLRRGDALEYSLVDRMTDRRSTVVYRLDRVEGDRMVFNQGTRVESTTGEVISVTSPIGGLFDSSSPPGGWGRKDLKPGMRWRSEYLATNGDRARHELDASVVGSSTVSIEGEALKVTRIDYTGWIYTGGGVGSAAAMLPVSFKGTALYSAELGRVVRFDSEFGRRSSPTKESLELVRVLR